LAKGAGTFTGQLTEIAGGQVIFGGVWSIVVMVEVAVVVLPHWSVALKVIVRTRLQDWVNAW
jgi:hypothetical protein